MPVQDDEREIELVRLFNLTVPDERGRSDIDAYLRLKGREIPFELKSTSRASISTVRDFGPEHIRKWRDLHWIFGFYDQDGRRLRYCLYASPGDMAPWIEERWSYVRPDVLLADHVPDLVNYDVLMQILGETEVYSLDDARSLHKRQMTVSEYRELMDLDNGYSPQRMLEILQSRCRYLIERGATLNNPHIPASYFEGWECITDNHAIRLREMVAEALDRGSQAADLS